MTNISAATPERNRPAAAVKDTYVTRKYILHPKPNRDSQSFRDRTANIIKIIVTEINNLRECKNNCYIRTIVL